MDITYIRSNRLIDSFRRRRLNNEACGLSNSEPAINFAKTYETTMSAVSLANHGYYVIVTEIEDKVNNYDSLESVISSSTYNLQTTIYNEKNKLQILITDKEHSSKRMLQPAIAARSDGCFIHVALQTTITQQQEDGIVSVTNGEKLIIGVSNAEKPKEIEIATSTVYDQFWFINYRDAFSHRVVSPSITILSDNSFVVSWRKFVMTENGREPPGIVTNFYFFDSSGDKKGEYTISFDDLSVYLRDISHLKLLVGFQTQKIMHLDENKFIYYYSSLNQQAFIAESCQFNSILHCEPFFQQSVCGTRYNMQLTKLQKKNRVIDPIFIWESVDLNGNSQIHTKLGQGGAEIISINDDPFFQYYNINPAITTISNGEIVAVWSRFFAHNGTSVGFMMQRYTYDEHSGKLVLTRQKSTPELVYPSPNFSQPLNYKTPQIIQAENAVQLHFLNTAGIEEIHNLFSLPKETNRFWWVAFIAVMPAIIVVLMVYRKARRINQIHAEELPMAIVSTDTAVAVASPVSSMVEEVAEQTCMHRFYNGCLSFFPTGRHNYAELNEDADNTGNYDHEEYDSRGYNSDGYIPDMPTC